MLWAVLACLAPPDADRVLIIENTASPSSVAVTKDYCAKRGVKNVLTVECQDSGASTANETMAYAEFKTKIEGPLRDFLKKHGQIDFIVMTKGVPIRLTDAPCGMSGKQPSLDSFVAALDYPGRKDVATVQLTDTGFSGTCWVNRFWNSNERFSHAKFGGYLVTRLDGYTVDEAEQLSAYSIQSEKAKPDGTFLLDVAAGFGTGALEKVPISPAVDTKQHVTEVKEMPYIEWNADMVVAAQRLQKAGFPVTLDQTDVFIGKKGNLMGYASWGSNDPKFVAEGYRALRFAPGGIAETAVSTSARTFLPTTGGQSLIADPVHARACGAKGYVDEPLLQAVASPTILFDRYTRGWTLAESYFAASRFVGWEDIVIGDPLCAPYAKR